MRKNIFGGLHLKRLSILDLCLFLISLFIVTGQGEGSAAETYAITDLGTLGGPTGFATGINSKGKVVGWSWPIGSTIDHAFLWDSVGGMLDLGTLGGVYSEAWDINDKGQVVGLAQTVDGTYHAFLWDVVGGMQDLGTLPGGVWSAAYGINGAGQVVGGATHADGSAHGFLWDAAGGMRDLGTLPGSTFGAANDINDVGQVVGYVETEDVAGNVILHAVLWELDSDGDGLPDKWEESGLDINKDGVIDLALNQPPFNANPKHKDLFIEVDYMQAADHGHQPNAQALQDVANAFAASPAKNPDNVDGITFHLVTDEAVPEVEPILFLTQGPGPLDDFDDLKLGNPKNPCGTGENDGHFGTVAERKDTNCANILAAKTDGLSICHIWT